MGSGKTIMWHPRAAYHRSQRLPGGAGGRATEILAEQHFKSIRRLLGGHRQGNAGTDDYLYRRARHSGQAAHYCSAHFGDVKESTKRDILARPSARGGVDIVLGTHSLVQKEVEFHKLGSWWWTSSTVSAWCSAPLYEKGFNPHMLVMTATPIPRTLALTLYGDLDLSYR